MSPEDGKGEGELILYRTDDGKDAVQLRLVDGTVWLTQAEIALLFETTPQNITQHLGAIYDQGELTPEATCKQSLQVRTEGERNVLSEIYSHRPADTILIAQRNVSLKLPLSSKLFENH